jgi:ABC-type nitrate/sulfonate/bicarbonate transport system substrate-binding protein
MALLKKILFLATLLTFSACSKGDDKNKLRLLFDWQPNVNHLPLIYGLEKGIFKKYGIDLSFIFLQDPPSSIAFLNSNHAEIALTTFPSALKAYKRSDIKIIGTLIDKPLYGFLKQKTSCSDFGDAKNLNLITWGDSLSSRVEKELKKREITFKTSKVAGFDLPFLFSKQGCEMISSYWNIDYPYVTSKQINAHIIKWEDLNLPSYPEIIFIAKKEFIDSNQMLIEQFSKALQEAINQCLLNQEEAFKIYIERFKEKKISQKYEVRSLDLTLPLFAKSQKNFSTTYLPFIRWFFEEEKISKEYEGVFYDF